MTGILIFAAKRAVIARLTVELGGLDDPIQVSYAFPVDPERRIVYGATARTTRSQALAEWTAAVNETAVIDIWLRVEEPGGDVESTEEGLEELSGLVLGVLYSGSDLGGGFTFADVTSAVLPEASIVGGPDPTVISRLQLQVSVRGVG